MARGRRALACWTGPVSETFRVLHVCTGNLCRSPLAERLMRAGLAERLGAQASSFEVVSAGTLGEDGDPMQPHGVRVLSGRGLDGTDFRARRLVREQLAEADLVLTATREHRVAAAALLPEVVGRTFTLRESARLAALVDPGSLPPAPVARAHALVAALARSRRPPARPGDDDLTDPYRGPLRGFTACAATIEDALRVPLDLLVP